MSQHTLSLFKILLANVPPLFSSETSDKMKNALDQLANDPRVTPKMVEDTMIKFGYDLWPWNEAFREFLGVNEGRLGEQFFLSHLPQELGAHYMKYKEYGLSWRDLYSGRAAEYYNSQERAELSRALVDAKNDITRFTDRELAGLLKEKYLARVADFKRIIKEIKELLSHMRAMADEEQYHPVLANEIRDRVRNFEMGLCLLGPTFSVDEVLRSVEFFIDRKVHLNMMRGIDKPLTAGAYR